MYGFFLIINMYILFYYIFVNLNKIVFSFYFIDWLIDIKLSVIKKKKFFYFNFWSYSWINEKFDMLFDIMIKDN